VGRDVGDVSHRLLIRSGGGEVATDVVGSGGRAPVGDGRADAPLALAGALDTQLAHQPRGALLADPDVLLALSSSSRSRRLDGWRRFHA
jgi:hypothetical protein